MKKIKKLLVIALAVIAVTSCKSEKVKDLQVNTKKEQYVSSGKCPNYLLKNKDNNLNISILLDLSDRIDEKKYANATMSYVKRDLGYINIISNSFVKHIEDKKLVLMNDKMQIYFEPEPLDASINEKAKILKTSFDKNLTKEKISITKNNYNSIPEEIYSLAKNNGGNYIGSDIWRFFKDKVKRYSIDDCSRNILIIITDGEMYHEDTKMKEDNLTTYITQNQIKKYGLNTSKWEEKLVGKSYGFIPATSGLNDLEVLVLGVVNHNKNNPYGKDVLKKYWEDWFEVMGVKRSLILDAELPSNIENSISSFILNSK